MREEIVYICDICGNRSTDKDSIISCELKGAPVISDLPTGILYCLDHDMYEGITFYLTDWVPVGKHFIDGKGLATRENPHGDTLFSDRCSMFSTLTIGSLVELFKGLKVPGPNSITGKRMLDHLRGIGIRKVFIPDIKSDTGLIEVEI